MSRYVVTYSTAGELYLLTPVGGTHTVRPCKAGPEHELNGSERDLCARAMVLKILKEPAGSKYN
jgi:hypothetical protein